MNYPIQISFLNVESSAAVEQMVRQSTERLSRFYPRIASINVAIEMPHKSHHSGNIFQVRIDISVPGQTISVETKSDNHEEYQDVYVAIRDAFLMARRRLEDYAKRKLDAPKVQAHRDNLIENAL